MFSKKVIILDCGASQTALGVFSSKGRCVRCEDCAVEVLPAATGREENWLESTRGALSVLRGRVKESGPVVLILPAHLVLAKFIKVPRVADSERKKVIRFEAEQSIPQNPTGVVWDSVVAGEGDTNLEVLLTVAKLEAIEQLCTAMQAAGFRPRQILPAPLASLAAFRLVQPIQAGSALVLSPDTRSTTLLLVEPKSFVLRTLPLGGQSIAPQSSAADAHDAVAMESYTMRLPQEVIRTMLYFRRHGVMSPARCVLLLGGGVQTDGLDQALATRLKLPVDLLDPFSGIEFSSKTAKAAHPGHTHQLSALIGAAVTQLRSGQPTTNLLPPRLQNRENLRRRRPWLTAAAVLTIAAMPPHILHHRLFSSRAGRLTDAIERELVPLRERDVRNRTNLQQIAELRRQADQWLTVLDRRTSWLSLLADLEERFGRLGYAWLEELTIAPAADDGSQRLLISGCMLDQASQPAKAGSENIDRMKALLRDIDGSPYVNVVEEGQRFDNSRPGILKFCFVLVPKPARPL